MLIYYSFSISYLCIIKYVFFLTNSALLLFIFKVISLFHNSPLFHQIFSFPLNLPKNMSSADFIDWIYIGLMLHSTNVFLISSLIVVVLCYVIHQKFKQQWIQTVSLFWVCSSWRCQFHFHLYILPFTSLYYINFLLQLSILLILSYLLVSSIFVVSIHVIEGSCYM